MPRLISLGNTADIYISQAAGKHNFRLMNLPDTY